MKPIFIYITLVISLLSCTKVPANSAVGKTNEVLIICEDDVWASDIKPIADSLLTQYILPYFPDVETFKIMQRSEARWSPAFKKHRNIIVLKIDANHKGETASVVQRSDVYAAGQIYFEITAKSKTQLIEALEQTLPQIHDEIQNNLIENIISVNGRSDSKATNNVLASKFGINLNLPNRSKIVTNKDGFVRIEFPEMIKPLDMSGTKSKTDPGKIFSGAMIFEFDYKNENSFDLLQLCTERDSILKLYAKHEVQGMYMTTQYTKISFPRGSNVETKFGKVKGFEMRGMYKFTGMGMIGTGGPFWDFYFLNPKRNKIICVSTYLDISPMSSWTEYLRSIEAVWRSVKLLNQ